jgi:dipeptidyl aminopeptidase/acylaminoacyl peptidase
MPVLLMVGDLDKSTPIEHQKILFDKLPGKKEIHIIKGSPHTFKDPKHLEEIKSIFDKWIKSNL